MPPKMENFTARGAVELSPWRQGFTRVLFIDRTHPYIVARAIELPTNLYKSVCPGPSCHGATLADFARLFSTGLVRRAPACFTDFHTRGRVVLGETFTGRPLDWELTEWIQCNEMLAY